MKEWAGFNGGVYDYREEYLLEELRLESRGDAAEDEGFCCETDAEPNERLFRCEDCFGVELLCQNCCLAAHKRHPLHNVKVCSFTYDTRVYND